MHINNFMNAQEFYNNNKNFTSTLPKLPSNLNSNHEIANWLLNESDFAWLELDVKISVDKWADESKHAYYVDHRGEKHPGWKSACIHGIDVDKTGAWTNYGNWKNEKEVPYKWTSLSNYTPNIKKFWQEFPYEKYRRIRFMCLEAQGFISPHSDMPGRLPGEKGVDMLDFGVPINVAIVHPEGCDMTLENHGIVPFAEGKAFIINIRKYHSVLNNSKHDRIHLIAHGIPGNKKTDFIDLVARSYRKEYEKRN